MQKKLVLIILLAICYNYVQAQDTLFYRQYYVPKGFKDIRVTNRNASIYDVIADYKEGLLQATRYDKKENKKIYTATVLVKDSVTKDGYYIEYDSVGNKFADGYYLMGQRNGDWKQYYSDGNIWVTIPYKNDTITGKSLSYYKTGELKREEILLNGMTIGGKCYNKDGTERPFTSFTKMPEFSKKYKGPEQFISENIKYPRAAQWGNIQGRVTVRFIVQPDGTVTNVETVGSIHPSIDNEAIRVVKQMPPWEPGIVDDETVPIYFTVPVTFRLQ